MEALKTYKNEESELKNHLRRIGDIINIDGPVLSLFQDKRDKELYLFDWVDSDDTTNRWLIYKISAVLLHQFLLQRISYKSMFDSINTRDFYYTDIINSEKVEYVIKKLEYFPKKYMPTKDAFFDKNDSSRLDEIFATVNNILVNKDKDGINQINFNDSLSFLVLRTQNDEWVDVEEEENENSDEFANNFISVSWTSTILVNQQNGRKSNRILGEQELGLYAKK